MEKQKERSVALRNLHTGPSIFILPNAWDVASARIFEQVGFSAIGTTSGGIALALGYSDGQQISRNLMMETVGRIAQGVDVPVSADLEAGYADSVFHCGTC